MNFMNLLVALIGSLALANATPATAPTNASNESSLTERQDGATIFLCTRSNDPGDCSFGSHAYPFFGTIDLAVFRADCSLIGYYAGVHMDGDGYVHVDVYSQLPWTVVADIGNYGYAASIWYAGQYRGVNGCGDLQGGFANPLCKMSFRC